MIFSFRHANRIVGRRLVASIVTCAAAAPASGGGVPHGDTGAFGNSDGLLNLQAEYGAPAADEQATLLWLVEWGYDPADYPAPTTWNKDLIALLEAVSDAEPGGDEAGKPIVLEAGEYFPARSTPTQTPIVIPDGVAILGEASGAPESATLVTLRGGSPLEIVGSGVTLRHLTIEDHPILAERADDLVLRDLQITHITLEDTDGIDLRGCRGVRITDCMIHNVAGTGILVTATDGPSPQTSQRVFARSCAFTGCGQSGLKIAAGARTVVLSSCAAAGNGLHGFEMAGDAESGPVENLAMLGCTADGNGGSGIWIADSRNIDVSGGSLDANDHSGLFVAHNESRCENIRINETSIGVGMGHPAGNGVAGVTLEGPLTATVVACRIENNPVGVHVTQRPAESPYQSGIIVASNMVIENAHAGLRVDRGSSSVLVADNDIERNGTTSVDPDRGGLALIAAAPSVMPSIIVIDNRFTANASYPNVHIRLDPTLERDLLIIQDNSFSNETFCATNLPDCLAVGGTPMRGDFDGDLDIDLHDFGMFQACFQGADLPVTGQCLTGDFDCDADLDLTDYAVFQSLVEQAG